MKTPTVTLLASLSICAAQCHHNGKVDSLDVLNKTTNGRVHINRPYALPCFDQYNGKPHARDDEACSLIQKNYHVPAYRTNFANSYMNSQDKCLSEPDNSCLLDDADPTNPDAFTGKSCNQGAQPEHYLEITNACDAQAAFEYASATGSRVRVKNSGHDFLFRTGSTDELMLWTRNLQKKHVNHKFRPEGAPDCTRFRAMTIGAGVNCGEAYAYARDHNVTIVCGYAPTVGLSGGWVMNGGHSVLSAAYGLGVDRVLEFKVVTPDGVLRTANNYQNQDLFWALKGGGGNTFGVVLESTHKVEENFPVVLADIGYPRKQQDRSVTKSFMRLLIDSAVAWGDLGWGGHVIDTSIVYINALQSFEDAKKTMKDLSDFCLKHGGHAKVKQLDSFHDFFEDYIIPNNKSAGPSFFTATRLLSRSSMTEKKGRDAIHGIFSDVIDRDGMLYMPVDTPVAYKRASANDSSVTPGWYDAVWHIETGETSPWNSTLEERQALVQRYNNLTAEWKAISPDTGSYMNEANAFTVDWQEDFWGKENYESLLAIKNSYDPNKLMLCHRCIGWEPTDGDKCLDAFENLDRGN